MVEWFKAPVLKTGDVQASVGSNPTLSANLLADTKNIDLEKYPSGEGAPLLRE